jgi:hypothetical protein
MSQVQVNNSINNVNVGNTINTVNVDQNGENVLVIPQIITNVLEVVTPGPQGPVGPPGNVDQLTGSFVTTSSFNTFTSSYNTGSFTGSFIGGGSGLIGIISASYANFSSTSSFALNFNPDATSSYALNSNLLDGKDSSEFAITGSNIFRGIQIISGSEPRDTILQIHGATDNPWAFGIYNDTYDRTQAVLAGWVSNTGEANIGTEVNKPLRIYTNTNYNNPTLIISSSGITVGAGGITGSLFGTASWAINAITASYVAAANVAGLSLFQITTGSITASVGIGINDLFLIKSGSVQYFNISSSGNTTINSNLFIIRNFTTQQPVLTVSQSIVQFATQSSEPTGPTENGSIWFTSTNFYVGLD